LVEKYVIGRNRHWIEETDNQLVEKFLVGRNFYQLVALGSRNFYQLVVLGSKNFYQLVLVDFSTRKVSGW